MKLKIQVKIKHSMKIVRINILYVYIWYTLETARFSKYLDCDLFEVFLQKLPVIA
jgi:hypothetical protein